MQATPADARPRARPRLLFAALIGYFTLIAAAFATGNRWLDLAAMLVLVSLLLAPALRRRSAWAWMLWLLALAGLGALAVRGNGLLALDAMPIFVNAALCALFGGTLVRGREPLIARVIEVLEGAPRLALPRVAAYARQLTAAWALLFGAQVCALTLIVACIEPEGLLASVGVATPLHIGDGARAYLHFGSFAAVGLFMLLEYAFRRWHLREIAHPPFPAFIAELARRWPALVRRFADDAAEPRR